VRFGRRETQRVVGASDAYLASLAAQDEAVVAFFALCPCGCGEDLRWLARKAGQGVEHEVPQCVAAALVRQGAGV
jgi:hypothetical protein